jgi:hypothetical protein
MATRLQEATRLGNGKNRIKDTALGPMREQAGAELTQDRMIKTEVSQFQAQQILPIDPRADCIRGLPIGQAFPKLQLRPIQTQHTHLGSR